MKWLSKSWLRLCSASSNAIKPTRMKNVENSRSYVYRPLGLDKNSDLRLIYEHYNLKNFRPLAHIKLLWGPLFLRPLATIENPRKHPSMKSYLGKFPRTPAKIVNLRVHLPHPLGGVILGNMFLGLGKIRTPDLHVGSWTWNNSELFLYIESGGLGKISSTSSIESLKAKNCEAKCVWKDMKHVLYFLACLI